MNEMWAVHIQGPDDLIAVPDRQVADAVVTIFNRQFERDASPYCPTLKAHVVLWPYGYEAWKAEAEAFRLESISKEQP